ncbi:hypothetical protein BJX68DRAFT_181780 [Aspergillus pseudodeflectus]|uniref:Uncharacterized protein n=1 Tax=Aspergillus pseudodeflectus TaxID=176178 RepID=A0ABR4JQ70_9EURO
MAPTCTYAGSIRYVQVNEGRQWKILTNPRKHGIYRPTLMGMLKSNPEHAIQSATAAAFASLPSSPNSPDSPNSNDQPLSATLTSLNALTAPLRGIGPATASLLLSAASPAQIPFYSDDTFLWLIVGMYPKWSDEDGWVRGEVKSTEKRKMVKPSGELIAKYHVAEYKALFEAVRGLVSRLNGEREALGDGAKGEEVGCAELERVAFVVRHVRESGLAGIKGEDEDEDVKEGEDDKVGSEDEGASRKKRKVRK